MPRYIVFDVETPNRYNNRMSAIGISVVEAGVVTDSFFSYVDPEQPFDWFNTQLTGIDEYTVADAPHLSGTVGGDRADVFLRHSRGS